MFKIITMPFDRNQAVFNDEALTRFVLNKHVKAWQAYFFEDGGDKYWTVFVDYDPLVEPGPPRDGDGLSGAQKVLFDRLKAWRKQQAEKDGIPVYLIGTNREFTDIAKAAPQSLEQLRDIKGFGKAKTGKYGQILARSRPPRPVGPCRGSTAAAAVTGQRGCRPASMGTGFCFLSGVV